MSRIVAAAALFFVAVSCSQGRSKPTPDEVNLLDRALAAMGGEQKVGAVETIVVKGSATHWEPHQSVKPDGEMRLAGDSTFVLTRSFSKGAARRSPGACRPRGWWSRRPRDTWKESTPPLVPSGSSIRILRATPCPRYASPPPSAS